MEARSGRILYYEMTGRDGNASMKKVAALKDNLLKFCAVGDLSLANAVEAKIRAHGTDFPFSRIENVIRAHDVAFANLENVFTETGAGRQSQAHLLKSRIDSLQSVQNAGFGVVALANNHVLDYGRDAIVDTRKSLEACGIRYTGAGEDIASARVPAIIDTKGVRLGFLAYAMKGTHSAGPDQPGAAVIDRDQIAQDIKKLKGEVDHVIISLHYGLEFLDYPSPEFREICLYIADLGASLIVGHHPHVINGIENHAGCLIAYSLGNFIFDPKIMDYKTESTQQSVILSCVFDKNSLVEYSVIPAVINRELQPEIPNKETSEFMIKKIARISAELRSESYPAIYHKQANYLWPRINIMINLRLIRQQGFIAFLRRMPRIKKKYIVMLLNFLAAKAAAPFKKNRG